MSTILIVTAQKREKVEGQIHRELGTEGAVLTVPLIYESDPPGASPVAWAAEIDPADPPRGWLDRLDCAGWEGDVTLEAAAHVMGLRKKGEE